MNTEASEARRIRVARHRLSSLERYAIFAFGVVFLSVILILVVAVPRPTPAQFFVFRLTIALAAAGIGALIPGFLEFEQPLPHKGLIRAGGALALFVVIWFTNPAKLAIEGIAPPPVADARPLLERAVKLIDQRDYATSYQLYSTRARAVVSLQSYGDLFKAVREPLGERTKGPVFFSANSPNEYMGIPGPFVFHLYQSRFSGQEGVWAEVVGVVAEEGEWRMYTHTIGLCVPPMCTPSAGL